MRSLAPPAAVDPRASYEAVSSARRAPQTRAALLAVSDTVFLAYDAYRGDADDLAGLTPAPIDDGLAKLLKGNYASGSHAARELKGKIFNACAGRCCLCGQGSASTLDHYLPQTTFPEYAILPTNLVPACSVCNTNKGSVYREDGRAVYLHCYLDELPTDEQFLFADVECREGAVVVDYRVDPPAATDRRLAERIRSHFTKLRLRDYYIDEAVNHLGEMRLAVNDLRMRRGPAGVREYLDLEARSVAADKGRNHWRHALLESLARHTPYCDGACA